MSYERYGEGNIIGRSLRLFFLLIILFFFSTILLLLLFYYHTNREEKLIFIIYFFTRDKHIKEFEEEMKMSFFLTVAVKATCLILYINTYAIYIFLTFSVFLCIKN